MYSSPATASRVDGIVLASHLLSNECAKQMWLKDYKGWESTGARQALSHGVRRHEDGCKQTAGPFCKPTTRLGFGLFYSITFINVCACGGQKTTFREPVLFLRWILGTGLKPSSHLMAGAFTHRTSSWLGCFLQG